MRWSLKHIRRSRMLPLLLSGLVLFVCAMSSSAALHHWFHPDATSAEHQCSATDFARGQVDSAPAAPVLPAFCATPTGVALLPEILLLPSADYRFSSSRAPPSFLA